MRDKFRKFGAEKVVCWKFMIPLSLCPDWFMNKEDSKGYSSSGKINVYKLYHKTSRNIKKEAFEDGFLINPAQLDLFN